METVSTEVVSARVTPDKSLAMLSQLEVERLPLSPMVRSALDEEAAWQAALTSGDDYELCFTLPAERREALAQSWQSLSCPVTEIGRVVPRPGLTCQRRDGTEFTVGQSYAHFS